MEGFGNGFRALCIKLTTLIDDKNKLVVEFTKTNTEYQATDDDDRAKFNAAETKLDNVRTQLRSVESDIDKLVLILKTFDLKELQKVLDKTTGCKCKEGCKCDPCECGK